MLRPHYFAVSDHQYFHSPAQPAQRCLCKRPVCDSILTMLHERQERNTDEDFTLHAHAWVLRPMLLSLAPFFFAFLYRPMRRWWAGLSCLLGNKKYCSRASQEWKEALDVLGALLQQALETNRVTKRERERKEMCLDTQVRKTSHLKFRRASGQGFKTTLTHWCFIQNWSGNYAEDVPGEQRRCVFHLTLSGLCANSDNTKRLFFFSHGWTGGICGAWTQLKSKR